MQLVVLLSFLSVLLSIKMRVFLIPRVHRHVAVLAVVVRFFLHYLAEVFLSLSFLLFQSLFRILPLLVVLRLFDKTVIFKIN